MDEQELSIALISLFQGPVQRKGQEDKWQLVLRHQSPIRDYIAKLNLTLVLDEDDGYCYLRQGTIPDLPKLVNTRQMGHSISVLLVILRKKLQEFDRQNQDAYLIVSLANLREEMRLFLPDTSDEVKQVKKLRTDLDKVEEMGLMRKVKGREDEYEVLRILRSVIDANALQQMEESLRGYKERLQKEGTR